MKKSWVWKGTRPGWHRRPWRCEKQLWRGALTEKNDSGGGGPAGPVSAGGGGAVRERHGLGAASGVDTELPLSRVPFSIRWKRLWYNFLMALRKENPLVYKVKVLFIY